MTYYTTNTQAKFEIVPTRNQQWYNRLKAPNGKILCHSEAYTTKQNAYNSVEAIRLYSQNEKKFDVLPTQNYQHYWRLNSNNGNILCHSETYTTKQNAIEGAAACKHYAPNAVVVELQLA